MGVAVISIRSMRAGDLAEVVVLELANQPKPWSEQLFRDELAHDNRSYFVAVEGDVVGFGGVMVIGDEAHVTNLLVDERHRGKGIGRRLMVTLVEAAVTAGARHLTLEVRRKNHVARSLYSGMGLAPVGVRPGYYGDDDALILWVHDIDRPGFVEALG
jgi:ribosomal-protein-alanine N-acetyltransferase